MMHRIIAFGEYGRNEKAAITQYSSSTKAFACAVQKYNSDVLDEIRNFALRIQVTE
jgi:hypothetical protein